MHRRTIGLALLPVALTLLAACGEQVDDSYVIENDPGQVEHVEGSDLSKVTLTDAAAERLRIETARVTGSSKGLVVPTSAIFVDPDGAWWVYTNPEPYVYVRHEVDVAREHNGRTFLEKGPAAGAHVVTVGVAELYGVEDEVGH